MPALRGTCCPPRHENADQGASFNAPLTDAPTLRVGDAGAGTRPTGRYPRRALALLRDRSASGTALSAVARRRRRPRAVPAVELSTFPGPDERPEMSHHVLHAREATKRGTFC